MDTPLCDAVASKYGVVFDTHEAQKVRELEEAARNLCRVKGRHHSEQAMRRLMNACGFAQPEFVRRWDDADGGYVYETHNV